MKVSKKSVNESIVKNMVFPPTDSKAWVTLMADFCASAALRRGFAHTALDNEGWWRT
jgi:hypothetical protein